MKKIIFTNVIWIVSGITFLYVIYILMPEALNTLWVMFLMVFCYIYSAYFQECIYKWVKKNYPQHTKYFSLHQYNVYHALGKDMMVYLLGKDKTFNREMKASAKMIWWIHISFFAMILGGFIFMAVR